MSRQLSVDELLKKFNFKILNKGTPKKNFITSSGIARVGITLASNVKPHYSKQTNIVCFGASELNYFRHVKEAQAKKALARIKKLNPPLILLNSSIDDKAAKQIVKGFGKTHITIASVNMDSTALYIEISPWIARKIAPTSILHGTFLCIYGCGVLITGDSGCGKSESALELIKNGHLFIGDDAIEVFNFGQSLYGHPSNIAKHFIEVRGLGVLDVDRVFGRQKTLAEHRIHMIVNLVNTEDSKNHLNDFERIGTTQHYELVRGLKIPKYILPVTAGRPTHSLIESAVVDYKLKREGYNSGKEFLDNFNKEMKKGEK